MSDQIPVPVLPYGPYSTRLREWSLNYSAVLTVERDSDTGYRYIVLGDSVLGAVPGSLAELLGVTPGVILSYMDEQVQQNHNPPGAELISRWYFTCTVGASTFFVAPWQYLYRTVEDLGAVAPV